MKMSKQLIFKPPVVDVESVEVVRITPAASEVVTAVMREIGLSGRYIVSQMILFCKDKIKIERK